MSQLYNKVVELLDEQKLGYVFQHCLTGQEIASLVSKCGICYEGIRASAVPVEQLMSDLTEYFFEDTNTGRLIIKALEKNSINANGRVQDMTLDEIKTFFSNTAQLVQDNEFGSVVWALLVDKRIEANEHACELLESYSDIVQQQNSETPEEVEQLELLFEELDKKIENEIQNESYSTEEVAEMEEKIATLQLELKERLKEIEYQKRIEKRLNDKIEKFHEQLDTLKRTCSQLASEKGEIRQQIKQLEMETLRLRRVKREPQTETEAMPYHQLEREYKKLKYDLEKAQQELAELNNAEKERAAFEIELRAVKDEFQRYKTESQHEQERLQHNLQKVKEESASALESAHRKIQALTADQNGGTVQRHDSDKPRVGVFVDVQNMFYAAKDRYNARLDYAKLLDVVVGQRYLVAATAYVVQMPEVDQTGFLSFLEHNGYQVRSKELRLRLDGSAKGDWDMGIAIDIISMLDELDVMVLASGDGDFCALVDMVKQNSCRVEVVAFPHNTSIDLQQMADEFLPIGGDMLIE